MIIWVGLTEQYTNKKRKSTIDSITKDTNLHMKKKKKRKEKQEQKFQPNCRNKEKNNNRNPQKKLIIWESKN